MKPSLRQTIAPTAVRTRARRLVPYALATAALLVATGGRTPAEEPEDPAAALDSLFTGTDPAPEARAPLVPRATIEEVIVTAQKREENILDVPISMSALSGDQMRDSGVQDLVDVSNLVPNVQVNPEQNRAFVRGFGSSSNQTVEQSVAVVIDGVYYGRPGYLRDGFLDLERLEVLRGPQSTLFGKNAVAGVLSFVTANPQAERGGWVNLQGGDVGQQRYEGAVTGAIVPELLDGRLASGYRKLGGFIRNDFNGKDLDGVETFGVRGKGALHLGAQTDGLFTVQYNTSKQDAPVWQVRTATENLRRVYSAYDPDMEFELNRRTSLDSPTGAERGAFNANALFDSDLFGHLVTSQTSFSRSDDAQAFDADVGPSPLVLLDTGEDYRQIAQELRLHSGPGVLSYVGGLYFFRAHFDGFNFTRIFEATTDGRTFTEVFAPEELEEIFGPAQGEGEPFSPERTDGIWTQKTQALAAFGQLTWRPWAPLELTAGARLSHETKSIHMVRTITQPGVAIRALGGEEFDFRDKTRELDLSPRFSAVYDLTDEMNAYATVARGFKAGGYSGSTLQEENLKFGRERADTIELGLKGRFLGGAGRFNLGLFHMRFEDLQVTAFRGTTFTISNAAEATSRGLELDASVLPFEGLTLSGSLGFIHARYDDYTTAPCRAGTPQSEQDGSEEGTCDLTGRPLTNSPKWTLAIQADYAREILRLPALVASPLEGVLGWGTSFQSESFLDLDLDPLDKRPAFWLHDLRAGLRPMDGRWQLALAVRNLLDEISPINSSDVPAFAGAHWATINNPRTMSVTLGVNF